MSVDSDHNEVLFIKYRGGADDEDYAESDSEDNQGIGYSTEWKDASVITAGDLAGRYVIVVNGDICGEDSNRNLPLDHADVWKASNLFMLYIPRSDELANIPYVSAGTHGRAEIKTALRDNNLVGQWLDNTKRTCKFRWRVLQPKGDSDEVFDHVEAFSSICNKLNALPIASDGKLPAGPGVPDRRSIAIWPWLHCIESVLYVLFLP